MFWQFMVCVIWLSNVIPRSHSELDIFLLTRCRLVPSNVLGLGSMGNACYNVANSNRLQQVKDSSQCMLWCYV